jgi:hypothetical protein
LKRVLFWTAYAFGTLAFIFGLLLAQVPRGVHDRGFRLEVVIWGELLLFPADLSFAVEKNLES